MRDQRDQRLPAELQPIAERLRNDRYEASPLELDRIKQSAMAQASSRSAGNRKKGMLMRSKLLSTVLAIGLLLVTASVGLAVTGNFPGDSSGGQKASVSQKPSASASQYGGSAECKQLRRENRADERRERRHNRADERQERRDNRADERKVRGRTRAKLIRSDRASERRTKRANRFAESQTRRANRSDERRCRRTGTG